MATIKSYTDIEQSKKLAEILPLESADMAYYQWKDDGHLMSPVPFVLDGMEEKEDGVFEYIPCWSLAALLSVTRNYCTRFELTLRSNKKYNLFAMTDNYVYHSFNEYPDGIDEPIDVCVALIEKLHELKML